MTTPQYLITFVLMAIAITTVLVVGTLASAGMFTRRHGTADAERPAATREEDRTPERRAA